jgi:hypothetical protein
MYERKIKERTEILASVILFPIHCIALGFQAIAGIQFKQHTSLKQKTIKTSNERRACMASKFLEMQLQPVGGNSKLHMRQPKKKKSRLRLGD